jgi:hypothetical protein
MPEPITFIEVTFADMVGFKLLPLAEAPARPEDAKEILKGGPGQVFEKGELRWRYDKHGRLIRVIEYNKARDRPERAWQDDRNA